MNSILYILKHFLVVEKWECSQVYAYYISLAVITAIGRSFFNSYQGTSLEYQCQ